MPLPNNDSNYLRALFDSLDIGVVIANNGAIYVDVNQAACHLFGRSHADLIGHKLSEFIEQARTDEVEAQWNAFLRDGVQSGLFSIRLGDGSSRLLKFNARANFVPGLHCSFLTAVSEEEVENLVSEQGLLTMCAWTKQIKLEQGWIPVENYLLRVYGVVVSHGISPYAFASLDID
jgi:PAS domain S-box-containing protein